MHSAISSLVPTSLISLLCSAAGLAVLPARCQHSLAVWRLSRHYGGSIRCDWGAALAAPLGACRGDTGKHRTGVVEATMKDDGVVWALAGHFALMSLFAMG